MAMGHEEGQTMDLLTPRSLVSFDSRNCETIAAATTGHVKTSLPGLPSRLIWADINSHCGRSFD